MFGVLLAVFHGQMSEFYWSQHHSVMMFLLQFGYFGKKIGFMRNTPYWMQKRYQDRGLYLHLHNHNSQKTWLPNPIRFNTQNQYLGPQYVFFSSMQWGRTMDSRSTLCCGKGKFGNTCICITDLQAMEESLHQSLMRVWLAIAGIFNSFS